jgi:hypothetical protein
MENGKIKVGQEQCFGQSGVKQTSAIVDRRCCLLKVTSRVIHACRLRQGTYMLFHEPRPVAHELREGR